MEITNQIENLIGSESLERKGDETRNLAYKNFTFEDLKSIKKDILAMLKPINTKISKLVKARQSSNEA